MRTCQRGSRHRPEDVDHGGRVDQRLRDVPGARREGGRFKVYAVMDASDDLSEVASRACRPASSRSARMRCLRDASHMELSRSGRACEIVRARDAALCRRDRELPEGPGRCQAGEIEARLCAAPTEVADALAWQDNAISALRTWRFAVRTQAQRAEPRLLGSCPKWRANVGITIQRASREFGSRGPGLRPRPKRGR